MRRTSATGAERRARGFTLVELMVVLVIVGLMASAVVLTLPDQREALRDAERFGMHLRRAREEAVLGSRAVEVIADAAGYRFRRQRIGGWMPLRDGAFKDTAWSAETQPRFAPGTEQATFHFDPVGASPPQVLRLGDGRGVVEVSIDIAGEVRIDATAH